MAINYSGTKNMMEKFLPLLKKTPGARNALIGISSRSGKIIGLQKVNKYNTEVSAGAEWRQRFENDDKTALTDLDLCAKQFVKAARDGKHKEQGFIGSAYGMSKCLMTQLHRVTAANEETSKVLVSSVCPGLCRTHMSTGRGTFMSNVLWLASFLVGGSAGDGADTPVWLATGVPVAERAKFHGQFVVKREIAEF